MTPEDPEQLRQAFEEALSQPAESLEDEVERLTKAHQLLHNALQNS